jgi:hypothetical protein
MCSTQLRARKQRCLYTDISSHAPSIEAEQNTPGLQKIDVLGVQRQQDDCSRQQKKRKKC